MALGRIWESRINTWVRALDINFQDTLFVATESRESLKTADHAVQPYNSMINEGVQKMRRNYMAHIP
jgi:hypothetical protein